MEWNDLIKAYEALNTLESIGMPISNEQKKVVDDIESAYIKEELIPHMQELLQPLFSDIRKDFCLVVEHKRGEELQVRLAEKRSTIAASPSRDVHLNSVNSAFKRHRPAKKTRLKVTFPNGTVSCKSPAFLTLLDVVRYVGVEKVRRLNIQCMGMNIISGERYEDPRYSASQKEIEPGVYVGTYSDTSDKSRWIETINNEYNLGLKVSIVEG